MKPIDTHAHLQFQKFDSDRSVVVKRNSQDLLAVINPGADLDSSEKGVALAQEVDNFYAAVGVHPHHADNWDKTYLPKLENLISQPKVVAVGEIGLDNYQYAGYPAPEIEKQKEILIPQIQLSLKHQKPILFHCREAYDDLYEAIKAYRPLRGLVHCFMGDYSVAQKFVDLGLLISFAGNLTYKTNAHMREAAAALTQDKILLETDSPYLTPEPHRGQRNEPVNVIFVAKTIATVRKTSLEKIIEVTTSNARELFKI
ncbi:MAG TPA: TatD family hydrolase [Candidatus Saccharimonadales bacterium]|nr:TatD family hydrolase [Candidatus Saccharimonadales bacterium]